jgi:hypothetical protein
MDSCANGVRRARNGSFLRSACASRISPSAADERASRFCLSRGQIASYACDTVKTEKHRIESTPDSAIGVFNTVDLTGKRLIWGALELSPVFCSATCSRRCLSKPDPGYAVICQPTPRVPLTTRPTTLHTTGRLTRALIRSRARSSKNCVSSLTSNTSPATQTTLGPSLKLA